MIFLRLLMTQDLLVSFVMGELPVSGYPRNQKKGCLREVSAYGRFKLQGLYLPWTITKCPLMRGVFLQEACASEVSICQSGSTTAKDKALFKKKL